MQAASAILANAIAAPGGDGAATPDTAGGGDAFTSALAALMGVLGQTQPAPSDPAAPTPSGAASDPATPTIFQPGADPGAASAATATAAPSPLTSDASDPIAVSLAALDEIIVELEASPASAQPGDDATSPAANAGDASAAAPIGLGPVAPEPTAATASAEDLALVLRNALPAQTADDLVPAGVASPSTGEASASGPGVDPRLIRFVARATATPQDAPTANDASSPTGAPAPNVTPASGPATAGASDAQPAANGAGGQPPPPTAPANPIAAGLIVFNPSGAQPAPAPQPVAARPATAKAAAAPSAPAAASIKPASPPDIRPADLAQLETSRDDTRADAFPVGAGDDRASNDGQGSGEPSSGSPPPTTFQLAAAPSASVAPVAVPPAAAALAQAHGADITAQLAAQIAARPGALRSSFDFSLEPAGLGQVDVALKIDPQGGLSAVLSFDNPSVAAEARSRAGDLHQALQQAGFDISQSGLSFTTGGHGHGAAFHSAGQPSYASAIPGGAEPASPELPAINATLARGSIAGGLDITI